MMRTLRDAVLAIVLMYGLLSLIETVMVEFEIPPMTRELVHPRRM